MTSKRVPGVSFSIHVKTFLLLGCIHPSNPRPHIPLPLLTPPSSFFAASNGSTASGMLPGRPPITGALPAKATVAKMAAASTKNALECIVCDSSTRKVS